MVELTEEGESWDIFTMLTTGPAKEGKRKRNAME